MKLSVIAVLVACASAMPAGDSASKSISKRADACNIGYCMQNGGTTGGGAAGKTTTVKSIAELTAAAGAAGPAIILIDGQLKGAEVVKVAADKTILGAAGSSLTGVGLSVKGVNNVIIRNIKISKVLAATGDAIAVQKANNVWIDHVDVSSDRDHDKDYYDGLLDFTHGAAYVTVSNSYIHDHFKASLVGHTDTNGAQDEGKLTVTYANNYWKNINSRGPSVRFGTVHVFNNYYDSMDTGINTRMGAEVLVEAVVFDNTKEAIVSKDSKEPGFAVVKNVQLGTGTNTAAAGSLKSVPYKYDLLAVGQVKAKVTVEAGQTLSF